MTDQKDPADLARRFVDLWQDQMTAVLRDPEFGDVATRWWRYWMKAGFTPPVGPVSAPAPAQDDEGPDHDGHAARPTVAQSAWPSASAAASRDRDADMDKLARRVRELEERLAALESDDASDGGKVPDRPSDLSPGRRPKRS